MMAEYILSIDQGTTTTRAFIIDRQGNYIGTASQKFQQIIQNPDFWVTSSITLQTECQMAFGSCNRRSYPKIRN